ncbi:MAG: hypothetical protein WBO35_01220 [Candidatus Saccharimonadales bacterium]
MHKKNQKGSILVTILAVSIFLTVLLMALAILASANLGRARGRILQLQAQYAAESGADAAIAMLNDTSNPSAEAYPGTAAEVVVLNNAQYRATFTSSVQNGSTPKEKIITAVGKVYAPRSTTTPKHIRRIRVVAERTSGTTASSMLSRTIIDVSSGVKSIFAKEVYVNDYMWLQKNVNILVAEKVTVAGKDATAKKCSITGDGTMKKPTSFSDPAQTRTILDLAYNNCISPPGNNSNADFEVIANDPSVHSVQSMRIPWTQYMDNSYQNSVNGCSDWVTGGAIRDIPRTGNEKKTHYPDTGSNTITSCGSNGSVDLGTNNTFVIRDHVHIRASLCAASACNPIFKNPTSNMLFVFVEGTINFDSIRTTVGSGPIVFVTYGADPASKIGECPHGGSLYLGKSNIETQAPAAYLMATYGLCIYQTKFATNTDSLGGVAGKSIFISSNSGVPWSLRLDPNFPINQIPIDLSWRQVGYQRL